MPSTRVPAPKSVIKPGLDRARKLDVGDTVTLQATITRRGPWKGSEGLTVELPDGTRHTFYADRFEKA